MHIPEKRHSSKQLSERNGFVSFCSLSLSCRCSHLIWCHKITQRVPAGKSSSFHEDAVLLLLGWLMFWGRLLGRHSGPCPCRSGDCLMLPLPVSYHCTQKQSDDSHQVKVPLRSQELIHVKMREHLFDLNRNRHFVCFLLWEK